MIQFKLVSMDFVDGWTVSLPSTPHSGDVIEINGQNFVVLKRKFRANDIIVELSVERAQ